MGRRTHDEYWSLVTKIGKGSWKCNLCGVQFAGGVSRIKAHVDRIPKNGIAVCPVGRDSSGVRNSIASCSTHPQQAANLTNSAGVSASGQEMNETTRLFEGMQPSHHIEGEITSHSGMRAPRAKVLKSNAEEMQVILESRSPKASGSSAPTSEYAEQPDSKKQKIEIATASPEKGKSPLGQGYTSSLDVDILELEARKEKKGAALFSPLPRNEDLASDLAEAAKENDDLRSKLKGEKEHLENIMEAMNEYISHNEDLLSRLKAAEKELDELKMKPAALQNEKDSLTSADTANGGHGMIGVTVNGSIPGQNNTASTNMLEGCVSADTRIKINSSCTKFATRRLKQVLDELVSEEDDIKGQLKLLESRGKKSNGRVDDWLNKVQDLKKKAGHKNYTVDQFGCLHGPDILQLAEDMRSHQSRKPLVLSNEFVGESFEKNVKKMWKLLKDDQVFIIAIYGMGGVGKTCLATYMANEIKRKGSFNHVFDVTVAREFSISKLQHDIAERISAELDGNDEGKIARSLSLALEAKGKSVLILDDVWKNIDLQKVGIPLNVNGIKLILTSRLKRVYQEMNCPPKNIIEVCPLYYGEDWELFFLKLGCNGTPTALPLKVVEVEKSIAEKCGGLPLGINVMARTMKMFNDIHWWRHANKLSNLEMEKDMEEEVLRVLKFSYDNLVDKNLQNCFLHCALYDHWQIERSDLIMKFVDNKLINGMRTLQEIFEEGRIILDELKDHSLLISDNPLQMHGLVRNMARRVIKENHKYMVTCNEELTEMHYLQEWTTDLEVVSLMLDNTYQIPADTSPRCPRLSTLILSHNLLGGIPECFSKHMNALAVLDLSFNKTITCLPYSLSELRSLISLVLKGCSQLESVPPLRKLKALSRLDLSRTSIWEVQGLEELINLKWLDLSLMSHLNLIAGSVLPGLTNMQYLDLFVPFGSIEVEAKDLEKMSMLECFAGSFEYCENYNNFVPKIKVNGFGPKTYHLHSGTRSDRVYFEDLASRAFMSADNVECRIVSFGDCEDNLIHLLPTDLASLDIYGNNHWIRLCTALSSNGPTSLSSIEISHCTELESLFCSVDSCSLCTKIQELEACHLVDLESLTVICREDDANTAPSLSSPNGVFSSLKCLYILGCHKIEKLLTPGLLPQLQNLETLDVTSCHSVKEIFALSNSGNDDDVSVALPKLTELTLVGLPKLKIVCKATIVFGSMPKIVIKGCPKLESFPITITQAVDFDASDSD